MSGTFFISLNYNITTFNLKYLRISTNYVSVYFTAIYYLVTGLSTRTLCTGSITTVVLLLFTVCRWSKSNEVNVFTFRHFHLNLSMINCYHFVNSSMMFGSYRKIFQCQLPLKAVLLSVYNLLLY